MKTYSDYLAGIFPGMKVQKISIDAGFTCPNRDGTISTGGCIYCRNDSFSPDYCRKTPDIKQQLEKGKKFFSGKYPEMKYLAYFQSYTSTYKKSAEELKQLYQEALEVKDIVGIIVATRPDCITEEILDVLAEINKTHPVFIEFGIETGHNETLQLINRNHTWEDSVKAIKLVSEKHLHCGVHLIAGLPGENEDKILDTIEKVSRLPIETIKLHQLQILKETELHKKLLSGEIQVPEITLDNYLELCLKILEILPERIIVERFLSQSPPGMVVSPSWGLKNYEFMSKLAQKLKLKSKNYEN